VHASTFAAAPMRHALSVLWGATNVYDVLAWSTSQQLSWLHSSRSITQRAGQFNSTPLPWHTDISSSFLLFSPFSAFPFLQKKKCSCALGLVILLILRRFGRGYVVGQFWLRATSNVLAHLALPAQGTSKGMMPGHFRTARISVVVDPDAVDLAFDS
jgi:hypothetical protein